MTPDYIPTDIAALKSLPPFTAPDGSFSWLHPMGTDNQGRDLLARVLQGGQISLMVGIIATLMSLIIGVSYGAVAGYLGGRLDSIMMRLVDVLYSLPYIIIVIVLLSMFRESNCSRATDPAVPGVGFRVVVDDGADRARTSALAEEPGIRAGSQSDRRFDSANHFPPPGAKHHRASDCLRYAYHSDDHADGSVSIVSWGLACSPRWLPGAA